MNRYLLLLHFARDDEEGSGQTGGAGGEVAGATPSCAPVIWHVGFAGPKVDERDPTVTFGITGILTEVGGLSQSMQTFLISVLRRAPWWAHLLDPIYLI